MIDRSGRPPYTEDFPTTPHGYRLVHGPSAATRTRYAYGETFPDRDALAPNRLPRKRLRVVGMTFGAVAVAVVASATTAFAVANHSGPAAPAGQVAAPVAGKPSPATGSTLGRPAATAAAGSVEEVSAKVLPSVVQLQIQSGRQQESGSGIVLSADGLILTNNHVVASAAPGAQPSAPVTVPDSPFGGQLGGLPPGIFPGEQQPGGYRDGRDGRDSDDYDGRGVRPSARTGDGVKATVTLSDGRTVPFTVVGADPDDDIAVVRAQGVNDLTPISIGSSKDLKVGQNVVAVGSPLGLQGTVTTGIISALNRPVATGDDQSGQRSVMSAIQTDAAINPGNSGGALVDMNGNLIGVNSAIASLSGGQDSQGGGQAGSIGLGFAIPVDQAKRIADELVSTGTVRHASLGVQLASSKDTPGAVVAGIVRGSAAATAGLPKGAVITKVDNQVIDGPDALVAAVRAKAPGDTMALTYQDQSGDARTVQVTLGQSEA
ncbi:putative serine protease [Mycobacteroides abscessus subsp. massiliense]|uniref:Serine protease n=4 Tax=Mycobacteroides abscessus TaxID=36809 RepID=A0AB33AGV1_9MYCO|nr:trypsin-like peptidase domain-containing protein [Mycobacteroides abscessus]AGM30952.1 putative serine protease [Mycobacteroides abscessus subsp. bolletii 50594]SKG29416.1 putative serine protease [Mycobacteroides abscessus subsp. massiliense]SKH44428.1 putative serine protease [Mycobacteroides abscessus subsp. massiliense]SKH89355.1 putative serine protease [Mycobacteroides abscessus subsp. massiliense]SKI72975.1 putative serine protease [Mycobacteroides abscessus subsp. massiliense]